MEAACGPINAIRVHSAQLWILERPKEALTQNLFGLHNSQEKSANAMLVCFIRWKLQKKSSVWKHLPVFLVQ